MAIQPIIPESIRVHLGPPSSDAPNVTVSFPDYIKNVASGEIYPTWPESALRANIYAQISFALNRIYTEWYPSQGYDFDITSSTAYDQSYADGRAVFDNISLIVDDIFNSYVRRQGSTEPLFTAYCSGRGVDCDGLKQWDTVTLAEQGLGPYQILQYYYGDDIDIVTGAPVAVNTPSYPGIPLREGDVGNDVQLMQVRLNRIARNYPGIPTISEPDGIFGTRTTAAVKRFQQVFGLDDDGVVGNATWYRIAYIYSSVKRLAELDSEGIAIGEIPQSFAKALRPGDSGDDVRVLQYYLRVIAQYNNQIPVISVNGVYDDATERAVRAYQQANGLGVDGVVARQTWNSVYNTYRGIIAASPTAENQLPRYPGGVLRFGATGANVVTVQQWLNRLSQTYADIPAVSEDGEFGVETDRAVRAFQQRFGITPNGVVGAVTWDALASAYDDLR